MSVRGCTRDRDEEVLAMLAARAAGVPDKLIARHLDVTSEINVRQVIHNVKRDDLAYSGEPAPEVLRHYGKRAAEQAERLAG